MEGAQTLTHCLEEVLPRELSHQGRSHWTLSKQVLEV